MSLCVVCIQRFLFCGFVFLKHLHINVFEVQYFLLNSAHLPSLSLVFNSVSKFWLLIIGILILLCFISLIIPYILGEAVWSADSDYFLNTQISLPSPHLLVSLFPPPQFLWGLPCHLSLQFQMGVDPFSLIYSKILIYMFNLLFQYSFSLRYWKFYEVVFYIMYFMFCTEQFNSLYWLLI